MTASLARPRTPAAAPLARGNETVLVVDDDPAFAELVCSLLEPRTTVHAASVAEAIGVLERQAVDVVVCDHSMPRATGLNLLAYVRARGLPVRFVLASAALPPGVAATARAAGARVLAKSELVDLLA